MSPRAKVYASRGARLKPEPRGSREIGEGERPQPGEVFLLEGRKRAPRPKKQRAAAPKDDGFGGPIRRVRHLTSVPETGTF
jgi:hypothetical protein